MPGSRLALIAALVLVVSGLVAGGLAIRDQDKGVGSATDRQRAREMSLVFARANRLLERRTATYRQEQARRRLISRFRPLPDGVSPAVLDEIASCESGGDPRAVSANGLYHGKYQFHPDTWESVGGTGLPSRAPEVEQDFRAALLLSRSGPGQWPVCGA